MSRELLARRKRIPGGGYQGTPAAMRARGMSRKAPRRSACERQARSKRQAGSSQEHREQLTAVNLWRKRQWPRRGKPSRGLSLEIRQEQASRRIEFRAGLARMSKGLPGVRCAIAVREPAAPAAMKSRQEGA